MLILGLLGMYFDAAVVFVTKSSLFFRLAVAILCQKAFRKSQGSYKKFQGRNPYNTFVAILVEMMTP